MKKESKQQELQELISRSEESILYIPTQHEVDYHDPSFPVDIPPHHIFVPQDRKSDPFDWAAHCIQVCQDKNVSLFIPGTQCDRYSTRWGRGGGWYDRFLSRVPSHWLRICIVHAAQFSSTRLLRQDWDEPMDWIIVKHTTSWEIYKT